MRRVRLSAIVLALAVSATGARAQDPETVKIMAVVQKVFDAMRTRDTSLLSVAFDTSARLVGVGRDGALSLDDAVAVRRGDRAGAGGRRVERANIRSRGSDRRGRRAGLGVFHLSPQQGILALRCRRVHAEKARRSVEDHAAVRLSADDQLHAHRAARLILSPRL